MRELSNNTASSLPSSPVPTDSELIRLFQKSPQQAWSLFIDRYADRIFSLIRSLGFDYDQAMDRFVFVCEKLSEKEFRRLKAVKYAGSHGDLTPWIRQVVKRLCISWAWSEHGRRRLLKPIAELGPMEQRVFELYFWHGLSPSEIDERLRQEHFANAEPGSVFRALDQILSRLSEKKLWRLISSLARARGPVSLDETDEAGHIWDAPDPQPDPETELIQREQIEMLRQTFAHLPETQLLILQFRFEHALSLGEIAQLMQMEEREVRRLLDNGLETLRKTIKNEH